MRSRLLPSLVLLVAVAGPALADDAAVRRLEEENARLRARVAELEREVATLKKAAPSAPLAAAMERRAEETVVVSDGDDGGIAIAPTLLEREGGAQSRHWIAFRTVRGAPNMVEAVIETDASGHAYRDVKTMQLTIDGRPYECAVTAYRTETVTAVRQGSRVTVKEILRIDVPKATLARLADATEASGQLGKTRFTLTPEQLASIKAFQRRVAG
jgi:cell division septum initiation protein DivIVA